MPKIQAVRSAQRKSWTRCFHSQSINLPRTFSCLRCTWTSWIFLGGCGTRSQSSTRGPRRGKLAWKPAPMASMVHRQNRFDRGRRCSEDASSIQNTWIPFVLRGHVSFVAHSLQFWPSSLVLLHICERGTIKAPFPLNF